MCLGNELLISRISSGRTKYHSHDVTRRICPTCVLKNFFSETREPHAPRWRGGVLFLYIGAREGGRESIHIHIYMRIKTGVLFTRYVVTKGDPSSWRTKERKKRRYIKDRFRITEKIDVIAVCLQRYIQTAQRRRRRRQTALKHGSIKC